MSEGVGLREALKTLSKAIDDALAFFEKADPADLPTLLKAFAQLKEHKETLDDLQDVVSSLYSRLSYEVLPHAFETLGFDSVKTAGKNFILSTRVNANIPENKRDAAHRWLTEEAGVPELIIPRVNPKQLSSFVTQYFEAHGMWPPEEAINIHQQNYIAVRKA